MIPSTQIGYGFKRGQYEINRFDNLPVPKPGKSELLIKIEAAGLCRLDLHILKSQSPPTDTMVMGHEITGSVAQAGSDLDQEKYKVGARYTLSICSSCGSCDSCRLGLENQCEANQAFGITIDGGFQQYLLVKNLRCLVPIPDGVLYAMAASATDAILTPFHAISKVKSVLGPAAKVLVVGAGGLGLNAIQVLRVYGCHIVCVEKNAKVENLVLDHGANEFHTDFSTIKHPRELFDVCFDFVGHQETAGPLTKWVKSSGHIVIVGMANAKLTLPNYDLSRREVTVHYNYGGTSSEQKEILEWMLRGFLNPVVSEAPMGRLPEYMEKLRKGELVGRTVFIPHKSSLPKL